MLTDFSPNGTLRPNRKPIVPDSMEGPESCGKGAFAEASCLKSPGSFRLEVSWRAWGCAAALEDSASGGSCGLVSSRSSEAKDRSSAGSAEVFEDVVSTGGGLAADPVFFFAIMCYNHHYRWLRPGQEGTYLAAACSLHICAAP